MDVQGDQLSCVIIDRLPFAVPSDPVQQARMEAIEASRRQALPRPVDPAGGHHAEAGLRPADPLATDRGVLMLLDSRIQRQSYGKIFLDSLPPYRLTQDIDDVEAFFNRDTPAS